MPSFSRLRQDSDPDVERLDLRPEDESDRPSGDRSLTATVDDYAHTPLADLDHGSESDRSSQQSRRSRSPSAASNNNSSSSSGDPDNEDMGGGGSSIPVPHDATPVARSPPSSGFGTRLEERDVSTGEADVDRPGLEHQSAVMPPTAVHYALGGDLPAAYVSGFQLF